MSSEEIERKHRELSHKISRDIRTLNLLISTPGSKPELISMAIDLIEGELRKGGFQSEHIFWERLNGAKSRVKQTSKKEEAPQNPNVYLSRRDYWGACNHHNFRVIVQPTEIYINHSYKRQIKISWGFNGEGRLRFIDLVDFKAENDPTRILETLVPRDCALTWSDAVVQCKDHPMLNYVDSNFLGYPFSKKIDCLVRYGHSSGGEINWALNNDACEDFPFDNRRPGKAVNLQLRDMKKDARAMYTISKVSSLRPAVTQLDRQDLFKLDYSQIKPKE